MSGGSSPSGFKAPFLPASLLWRLLSLYTYPAAGEEFRFSVFGSQITIITNHRSPHLLSTQDPLPSRLGDFPLRKPVWGGILIFINFTKEKPQAKMSLARRNIPPRLSLVSANHDLPSV